MMESSPEKEYAVWTIPGTSFRVQYALDIFHEVDFRVNEGYRRIPHGGIEVGGLLFGRAEEHSATIEAFREIECEHVSGPSFNLSDRDLEKLERQLEDTRKDEDLKGLVPLGWFVAHTRSPLRMAEKEAALFDRYFPRPGSIAVLVKPERFQATRFGFLVREESGTIKKDASEQAIILPLPGRGSGTRSGPITSIAAPVRPEPKVKPPGGPSSHPVIEKPPTSPTPPIEPLLPDRTGPDTQTPQRSEASANVVQPNEKSKLWPRDKQITAETSSDAPEMKAPVSPKVETRVIHSAHPTDEVKPAPNGIAPPVLPSLEEIRRRRSPDLELEALPERTRTRRTQPIFPEPRIWNVRLTAVLVLAAALGCGVGYFGYLQLPSAVIPLKIRRRTSALLVSWPAEQTRDAVYASIRVDDGQPMALTAEEKSSGVTEVRSAAGNVKIELTSKHWMRDSRGIIRYVKAPAPTPTPLLGSPPGTATSPGR